MKQKQLDAPWWAAAVCFLKSEVSRGQSAVPLREIDLFPHRDAYQVALAPHHPWMLRQAAELVFLVLPDRQYFLNLVCVQSQQEATPILRLIIHALTLVHTQTQLILDEHHMLELP